MQNACFTFLNVANKSANKKIAFAFGIYLLLGTVNVFAGPTMPSEPAPTISAIASPDPNASPTPGPKIDLTATAVLPLQEVQKNPNKTYQIGDRIGLLVELKGNLVENGAHLALNLPDGASKLEDQGWYIDPSSQFLDGIFRFIASPIQTGSLTLPTLLITKDDGTVVGRTSTLAIQVTGPEKKDQPELLDVTPASLPAKYWFLFAIITFILAGAISYGVYQFIQKKRKKPKILPITPNEPDHTIALRKIEALYQSFPYRLENLKPVAFGVSETLKEFFSSRFKIDATEATTDEMIELLRKEAIAGENLREIQSLFQDLDLVKFTKSENYTHFDESKYSDIKVKSQFIVQKWKFVPPNTPSTSSTASGSNSSSSTSSGGSSSGSGGGRS